GEEDGGGEGQGPPRAGVRGQGGLHRVRARRRAARGRHRRVRPAGRRGRRMTGRTISDKVIDAHAIDDDAALYRRVRIDAVLGHDATTALLIDDFERRGLSIWDKEKVLLTNDHFSPPS